MSQTLTARREITDGLLPCVHCGSPAKYIYWFTHLRQDENGDPIDESPPYMHWIECTNEHCQAILGPEKIHAVAYSSENRESLIARWNKRLSREERFTLVKHQYLSLLLEHLRNEFSQRMNNYLAKDFHEIKE